MKSTGIIRHVDELGRFVLPIELRRTMNIQVKDGLEIFIDEDRIILQKNNSICSFCSGTDDLVLFAEKYVCRKCLDEIKKL